MTKIAAPVPDEKTEVSSSLSEVDPLKTLLEFHRSIRLALKTLDGLVERCDEDIHVEAAALVEFFRGPLAWHDMDEEVSLLPRLRHCEHPERLDKIFVAVTRAHERLETAIEGAIPHLLAVANREVKPIPELLRESAQSLREVLDPHLRMEEQELFPHARLLLDHNALVAMSRELKDRADERKAGAKRAVPL